MDAVEIHDVYGYLTLVFTTGSYNMGQDGENTWCYRRARKTTGKRVCSRHQDQSFDHSVSIKMHHAHP